MRRSSSFSGRIGIITGIDAEARLARRLSRKTLCAAGDPAVARLHAQKLIADGVTSLMSFGIAGGLDPGLRPGSLIVADRIVTDERDYPALAAAAQSLGAQTGPIFGGGEIVATRAAKADLARRTGALAVDLESGPVAEIAFDAGIPFIAVRAVADPAWRGLPPAALLPLDGQGKPRLGAVLGSVWRRPWQIPALILTARDTRAALRALERACRILGR